MMRRGQGQRVSIVALAHQDQQPSAGEVRLQSWTTAERWARAAKSLGTLWLLAAVSVLLPVAHFVLVPGFLIAGPIVAFLTGRQSSGVLGGAGVCPACHGETALGASKVTWPLFDVCVNCEAQLRVERLS